MKKLKFHWGMFVSLTAIVAVMAVVGMSSCQRHVPYNLHEDKHYLETDSMLSGIRDLDTLAAKVKQFRSQGDVVGEMLACKYYGLQLNGQSLFDSSIDIHTRQLNLATGLVDTLGMISALNSIGDNYRRVGELCNANECFLKAMSLSDRYSDHNGSEAVKCRIASLNNIGNIEISLNDYTEADSIYRVALEAELALHDEQGMAFNYGRLGSINLAQGKIDSAWVYYRMSMEYNQKVKSEKGIALCHLHFGELHEQEGKYFHAHQEYETAREKLEELGDTWYWLEVCLAHARVALKVGEIQEAQRIINEAEIEARRIGSKGQLSNIYLLKSELAKYTGDMQSALDYHKEGYLMRDSIIGLDRNDELRNQRYKYDRNRVDEEKGELNKYITHLKRLRVIHIILIVLLSLMAAAIIASLVYAMRVRNRTNRLLRQIEETRSLFFTNVVHQLRTPLTAIMGSIDAIMSSGGKDAEEKTVQKEDLETIERQGNNLLMLVDRILEVGSVRSAIKSPEWRSTDGVSFVRMVIESYRERCVQRHIELVYVPRENSVSIDIVPRYLRTIVGSLIENAINYSPDFGKITVTTRVDSNMFIIRVADNGIGIGETDLPHVFEPFYRGAAAERIVDGIGIGLTVVRDMAMAMGGTAAVESVKDQGAVFTVKLPCHHEQGVTQELERMLVQPVKNRVGMRRDKEVRVPDNDVGDPNRPVVLVIEDHKDVARLVGQVLGKKFSVIYASDGEQGLAKAMEQEPALIVTDVKMPLMDGYELCRRIKGSDQLCHIPVIMLTARNSEEDRVNGIEAGADAYLVKPFVSEELQAWANSLIEGRKTLKHKFGKPQDDLVPDRMPLTPENDAQERFLDDFNRMIEKLDAQRKKLDMDVVARSFRLGESQLKRKIQELTGKNVAAYVAQLRMERAMKLLTANGDSLIGDIAEQCGYQDVAYFSRVFRQYYKMTPTQARQRGGKA